MKAAYKDAAGMRIDGRRILVDVERGRTVSVGLWLIVIIS
jgi:U1 small nuclear ribonucleoprotein